MSTSVTLSTCPDGTASSTRLDTSVPIGPTGAAEFAVSDRRVGVFDASSTGASFTPTPDTGLAPFAVPLPSVMLVAIEKLTDEFGTGTKVTPASSALTSAIAPLAV